MKLNRMLNINSKIAQKLDFPSIIREFAQKRARKEFVN